MSDKNYTSVYTTYDKDSAGAIVSALKHAGIMLMYKTSAETVSDDVLYEICVLDSSVNEAHNIIIENIHNLKGEI